MNNTASEIIIIVFLSIAVSLLLAFPAMWIWNWALVPAITILNPVTSVWKMWCIMILANWFFKSSSSKS